MVKNLVGPPVLGSDFVGRTAELVSAWNSLESGNSLLLASPRRIGKSSFARKLMEVAIENGWNAVYLDLQGIGSEIEFAERLSVLVRQAKERQSTVVKIADTIKEMFSKIKKVNLSDLAVEFREDVANFYNQLDDILSFDRRALIVVDELAVFLQTLESGGDVKRAEMYLNWIRRIRQERSDRISWIFCSSVSITNFVSQKKLSHTINDLYAFALGEMNYDESATLLNQLCLGANISFFSDDEISYLLGKIGWKLPFFIQIFFKKYVELPSEVRQLPFKEIVQHVFEKIANEHQLYTWSERLSGYGVYERAARALLNYVCQPEHKSERSHLEAIVANECGDEPNIVYAEVKQMLDNDGYLVTDESGEINFRSPIIREYWFNKYVK